MFCLQQQEKRWWAACSMSCLGVDHQQWGQVMTLTSGLTTNSYRRVSSGQASSCHREPKGWGPLRLYLLTLCIALCTTAHSNSHYSSCRSLFSVCQGTQCSITVNHHPNSGMPTTSSTPTFLCCHQAGYVRAGTDQYQQHGEEKHMFIVHFR
jgi:hypothetical protein